MSDITLTFPDGASRAYAKRDHWQSAGREHRQDARQARGCHASSTAALPTSPTPLQPTPRCKIIARTDPEALELIRHDAAHVMAEAVQALWPGTQVTIGPVIENGFFYDFAKQEPFHPDDLAKIEAKMREIIARNAPFTKELWSRDEAKAYFRKKGELFKIELIDAIPHGEDLKIYKQGDWLDLCRGPHMTSTGQIGNAFKLTHFAGSYWRGNAQGQSCSASTARRGRRRRSSLPISSKLRRLRSATTASSDARWTSFISRRRGPASCSGIRRAGSSSKA